ncbi:hypothetical protein C8R46DRAFT_1080808 [Mycena filopes]|nr:hypothetical protein C8R46DRAFT_1080808 [Mycena filopes]
MRISESLFRSAVVVALSCSIAVSGHPIAIGHTKDMLKVEKKTNGLNLDLRHDLGMHALEGRDQFFVYPDDDEDDSIAEESSV